MNQSFLYFHSKQLRRYVKSMAKQQFNKRLAISFAKMDN